MKRLCVWIGWVAATVLLLVCGAFESALIGWPDFFVLGGGLLFAVLGSVYLWAGTVQDEAQRELCDKRRRALEARNVERGTVLTGADADVEHRAGGAAG